MRRAPAAAALVEEDDPVGAGIEVAAAAGGAPRTGAAVEDDRGLPSGLPQVSQYTRFPSPTSSMPCSYGSIFG